jgi:ABC-type nitrate/sulfonate/bicarbonate transport system permease component
MNDQTDMRRMFEVMHKTGALEGPGASRKRSLPGLLAGLVIGFPAGVLVGRFLMGIF